MQIEFSQSRPEAVRILVQATTKGALPEGLERAMEEGAKAARFKGSAGQLFDGFVERDGAVQRLVLVGTGAADAEGRAKLREGGCRDFRQIPIGRRGDDRAR